MQVINQLVSQQDLGRVLTGLTGTTTTLTDATANQATVGSGSLFPIGSPIIITAGNATTGTATGSGATSLTDSGATTWVVNNFVGATVTAGTSTGVISSNTTTVLTVPSWTGGTPASNAAYSIAFNAALQCTYVSNYVASTGVITVSPAIRTNATDAVLITDPSFTGNKATRLTDAISRAFLNRLMRWQRTPLTFVPDGDLRGTTVTDYWTGTAATPTYVTPTFPAGSAAAAFGFAGMQRVLQSVTSNATNRITSNLIDVVLNSTVTSYHWYFQTAIRVVSGSGNAQFQVWDETNNVLIPVQVISGSDAFNHTTTSLNFLNIEGACSIPATCKQISFRLVSSATGTTIQMAPLVAFPADAVSFPIPNRIISQEYIGNFYNVWPTGGVTGPYALAFTEPITIGGLTHKLANFGDHFTVTFNFRPVRPVWFDELAYDPDLTAMTSTTSFPLDYCFKWARFEVLDYLYQREHQEFMAYGTRTIPVPSRWLNRRNAALKSAQGSEYEPEMINVVGRTN